MNKDDNQTLVEAAMKGDHRAFEELVRQYQKPIFNVVYRLLHDAEESRDVTQTAFIKSYLQLHSYDSSRKFFSWICRIAINEALNRQTRRAREIPLGEEPGTDTTEPSNDAARSELRRDLERALMMLKPELRAVVVLKHVDGMNYFDIGQTLDIPEKTVKSRLFEARRKLKLQLSMEAYL
jgi:RNA polymerase sigma-70 factor (ECF subfamily)